MGSFLVVFLGIFFYGMKGGCMALALERGERERKGEREGERMKDRELKRK